MAWTARLSPFLPWRHPPQQAQCTTALSREPALETAIAAAYKQVFGNIGISDSQRLTSLEAFLCDGRINVQGFMGGLVKSDLYKQKFFHAVSPMRGIELTTKHLLGRPPVSQQEISAGIQLIADQGFDAFVDSLTHSEEYLETFGTDTAWVLSGSGCPRSLPCQQGLVSRSRGLTAAG